jgi:NhaP-type Na+/H+ or K+/H+ antiporter
MGLAQRRQWMSPELGQLGVVAMPLLCILAAEESGASMFIAAFVAGLAAQVGFPKVGRHSVEFTEGWGQLFNWFVFFLFGLLFALDWQDFTPLIVLYAVLSLTVVRMLPVALAVAASASVAQRCFSSAGSARAAWRRSSSGWFIWSSRRACRARTPSVWR